MGPVSAHCAPCENGFESGMTLRDRIIDLRRVPADELRANPKNWRRHPPAQAKAPRAMIDDVGFADALIARETPEGLMLIDGHLRLSQSGPADVLPVLVLDVDEAEADRVRSDRG